MAKSCLPFLMFTGEASEALDFYAATLPGAEVVEIVRYGEGEQMPAGKVKAAVLTVAGQRIRAFDSPPVHDFTFTPAISFFVECESEAELREVGDALAEGGAVMMPADNYGFSQLFTWVEDRFGVAWQLNLA